MKRIAPIVLGLAALMAAPALAEDAKPVKKGLVIGETVPAFEAKTFEGASFDFAKARSITADSAWTLVADAAKAAGAKDPTKETTLESIKGLDTAEGRAKFVAGVGKPLGLLADPAKLAGWKTLGDVAGWVETAAKAPIVFVAWSSGCPTCKLYETRVNEIATSTGARIYLLASNYNDEDAAIKAAIEGRSIPFPVLMDRDAKLADVLGSKKTPHVFALDATNTIRYAGAIDSDATAEEAGKATPWLKEAVTALAAGRSSFDVIQTAPKG